MSSGSLSHLLLAVLSCWQLNTVQSRNQLAETVSLSLFLLLGLVIEVSTWLRRRGEFLGLSASLALVYRQRAQLVDVLQPERLLDADRELNSSHSVSLSLWETWPVRLANFGNLKQRIGFSAIRNSVCVCVVCVSVCLLDICKAQFAS